MASLMTGRYPSFEGIAQWTPLTWYGFSHPESADQPILTDRVEMLAEILSGRGWATVGFHTNPNLSSARNFNQGFDHYEEFTDWLATASDSRSHRMQGHYPPATVVVDRVAAWFEEHGTPQRPLFLWVHLMDTHSPYLPPAPWRDRFTAPQTADIDDLAANDVLYHYIFEQQDAKKKAADYPLPSDLGLDLESLERHWRALYHGETAYADAEIGRLRDVLERAGMWDDAVVVVTSDHGEEFGEHGRVAHNRRSAMAEELIRIPLVVRPPMPVTATGTEVDALVRMVDLAPTVLDLVGATDATASMDGRTLRPLLEGRTDDPRVALISGIWWGIVHDGRWKYRLEKSTWTGGDTVERLFDVERDPLETSDVAVDEPDVLARLRAEWDRGAAMLRQRAGVNAAGDGGELDQTTREQLEALGYVAGQPDPTPSQ